MSSAAKTIVENLNAEAERFRQLARDQAEIFLRDPANTEAVKRYENHMLRHETFKAAASIAAGK